MEDERDLPARLSALRLLHQVVADLNAARDLSATLQAVADGVVSSLGFRAAAVNVVRPDGDLEVAAVAAEDAGQRTLIGEVGARELWDAVLQAAEAWGALRFLSHRNWPYTELPARMVDEPVQDEPGTWHPQDALLAPLSTPDGELIGILSVDMPRDGQQPGPGQRELLEVFAGQAAIAIDNARLRGETLHAVARLEAEQRALRASEESFRQAFENAPSGMAMTSLQEPDTGRLMRVNDALCRMLGYSERTLRRIGLPTLVHADDRASLDGQLTSSGCSELRLMRSDGSTVWVALRASVVPDASGQPYFLLTHVEDIEDRKRHEQRLAHRASHDPLTGLPNRSEFYERLGVALDAETALAVLFCDLDNFKAVNDQYGHHAGDAVLIEVAGRLRAGVRDEDTVARVGGDEFVVMAEGISRGEAEDLAERLSGAFAEPIGWDEELQTTVSASFGVSWSDGGVTADEIMRVADQEMYRQKRSRAARPRSLGLSTAPSCPQMPGETSQTA